MMTKLLYKYVFCYYFALTAFWGFLDMLNIHYFEYSYLLTLAIIVCGFQYFSHNTIDKIDLLLLFTIMLISCCGYINNPYKDLFKVGFLGEMIPMFTFYIGKDKIYVDNLIFNKGIYAVLITCFLGLILYIIQPSWYLVFRISVLTRVTDYMWLEMTRLSAFWVYPYWISYGVAIIYTYMLGEYIVNGKYKNKATIFILLFLFVISLLTQQRASIGGILLATCVYIVVYKGLGKKQIFSVICYIILIITLLYASFFVFSSVLDASRLEFMLSKFEQLYDGKSDSFLSARANLFDNMKDISITWFGDGLGLYSHSAESKGLVHYITDQGYMKMLYETGIIGFGLRMFIIIMTLWKGIINFKKHHFSCIIIAIILISLFGANSLSSSQMHNIIFWFCCGCIWNKQKNVAIETNK